MSESNSLSAARLDLQGNSRAQDLIRRALEVCRHHLPLDAVRIQLRTARAGTALGTRRYAFLPSHLAEATSVALDVVVEDPRTVSMLMTNMETRGKLRADLAASLPLNVSATVRCVHRGRSLALTAILGELVLGETLMMGLCMSQEFVPLSLIDAIVKCAREHKEDEGELRTAVTALLVEHHKEGDVITAADINRILAELGAVSQAVRRLDNDVETLKKLGGGPFTRKFGSEAP